MEHFLLTHKRRFVSVTLLIWGNEPMPQVNVSLIRYMQNEETMFKHVSWRRSTIKKVNDLAHRRNANPWRSFVFNFPLLALLFRILAVEFSHMEQNFIKKKSSIIIMKTVYLLHFLLFQMSKTNLKMSRIVIFIFKFSKYFTAEKSLILQIRVDGTLHSTYFVCLQMLPQH